MCDWRRSGHTANCGAGNRTARRGLGICRPGFALRGQRRHDAAAYRSQLVFVLLVPLQFVPSLRRRYPQLHRWVDRLIMGLGVVIGISALWLSAHPVGGLAEGTATIFFGCFFLFSLAKAWWHIRNGRVALHREWFTRMVAIALGVATTRPIIGIFFATRGLTGLTPQQFFGPAMWLGFVSTYLAGEAWINYTRSRTPQDRQQTISYFAEKAG
jgi:hypothetical protein